MKNRISVILVILGVFSILFSFVGISMLFDPNETEKGIDIFLIIFFIALGISLIIFGAKNLKSALAKNKTISLNANQYRDNKKDSNSNPVSNKTITNNPENPYEVNFDDNPYSK